MSSYKYLIIGGGMGGGKAAEAIRKVDAAGSIALVTAEPHVPIDRTHLSKDYMTGQSGLEKVYLRDDAFYAQNGIELLRGVRAIGLEPAAHRVTLADGRQLGYEKLLLATGGRALRLPIPGADLAGVFTMRTIADANGIRAAAQGGRAAVVIGGSFMGCEVAASLAQVGARVTLVFPGTRCLEKIVPPALSELLHVKYAAHGAQLRPGCRPARIEGAGRVERVILEGGETLPADLVVMGVGIQLETDLARQAGLALTDKGAIIVDEFLRTSDPDIYAVGDVAAWPDPIFGRRLRVEHWDVARRQGARVGRNMAGDSKPYGELTYFYSDLFDLSPDMWGDLSAWQEVVLRGSPEKGIFTYFYFDQGRLTGALTAGTPDDERKKMQTLVKARPMYEAVAGRLSDETVDLASI